MTQDSSDNSVQIKFTDLDLPSPLLRAIDAAAFTHCTGVQALTLPHIIEGRDVAAQAQTGTGKTAAFLLGAMAVLLSRDNGDKHVPNQPRMLVIAPTRELAIQIAKDATELGQFTSLKIRVVYGGADYEKQRRSIDDGVDILIGTPGRLIDYHKKRVFDFKALEIVVLDEADRMFDLGFIADIRFMFRRMPAPTDRISMLFSATLSARVMELAYEHMNNPTTVKTTSDSVTADGVVQQLFHPATDEKISLLLGLLRKLEPPRSIVFVNTKRAAEQVEGFLVGNGVSCGTLSGDVRQKKRQKILADFTTGKLPVLIATDVAARGLHIDDVSHVFNFDLPQQAEDYVHRIGRTARAGTKGVALSFACEKYSFSLPDILEFIGQEIPTTPITDDLLPVLEKPAYIARDRVEKTPRQGQGRRMPGRTKPGRHKPANRRSRNKSTGDSAPAAKRKDQDSAKKLNNTAQSGDTARPKARRRRRRKTTRTADSDSGPAT